MTDLSIIIVSYNTAQLTKKCIETIVTSLNDSKIKTEIILFDNNSKDKTKKIVTSDELRVTRNKQIKLKTIWNKKNIGFAKGNNEAVKQAEGKVLLFLNSDIEVLNHAIEMMYQFFIDQNNPFQFLGAKLFEKDGKTPQPSCGSFYTLPVVFAALFLKGDHYSFPERNSIDTPVRILYNYYKCHDVTISLPKVSIITYLIGVSTKFRFLRLKGMLIVS